MDTFPFSTYLFWNAELTAIDLEKNKAYMIERVITRGHLTDFYKLIALYSRGDIVEALTLARQLDTKTVHFYSWLMANECFFSSQSLRPGTAP